LDVRHRLAVKEEALRFIAGGCAVPLERVTACGDDASDVAMLRLAGRAVMVGDQPADGVDAPRLTRDRLAGHLLSLGAP
jgi:phosphoserine phosphatase